jgi:hypothetical protein
MVCFCERGWLQLHIHWSVNEQLLLHIQWSVNEHLLLHIQWKKDEIMERSLWMVNNVNGDGCSVLRKDQCPRSGEQELSESVNACISTPLWLAHTEAHYPHATHLVEWSRLACQYQHGGSFIEMHKTANTS